jgi:hypothetical protein
VGGAPGADLVPASRSTPRIAATTIGFAANNLLPARIGEFARAFVMGRTGKMPVSAAFASMVMERVLDGFVCVGFLFIAMAWPGFRSWGPATASIRGRWPWGSASSRW